MRNVPGLSAVLLICIALSSCSGNRPEKAFIGTWEHTTAGGAVIEISFMESNILEIKVPEGTDAGTWTVDPDGNAVITFRGNKTICILENDRKIVTRNEDGSSSVLEKRDSKKK